MVTAKTRFVKRDWAVTLAAMLAWAVVVSVAAPRLAAASPLFELAGGPQGALGINARATGPGPASTYFNPALLSRADPGFSLGLVFLRERINIVIDSDATMAACAAGGCDVPEVFGTGPESFRHADGTRLSRPALPTSWLEQGRAGDDGTGEAALRARPQQAAGSGHSDRAYQMLGLVSSVVADRLTLGLYVLVPLRQFTSARAFYNDEREQYFSNSLHPELYSDRLTASSLAFGGGLRITDDLAFGVTFTLSLRNLAAAPVFVSDLGNLDSLDIDSNISVDAAVASHFGVIYDLSDALQFAATVHTHTAFEIQTDVDYLIATGTEQSATAHFTHAYNPATVAVGATYKLGSLGQHRFSGVATGLYARWSAYVDRHGERPSSDYGWSDTLSGAVGLRHGVGDISSFLDLSYQPSPVPAQTGRTNYVDNNRLGVGGGIAYEWSWWQVRMRLGLHFQMHRLMWRHVTKLMPDTRIGATVDPQLVVDEVPDDAVDGLLGDPIPGRDGMQSNNPGSPGYGSGGWIYGGGLMLTIL